MKSLLLSAILFFGASAANAQTTSPQPLTLPEAVAIALKNNPTVQAADAYAEAVQQGITVAASARYPRVDFSEGFARGNNPVYVFGSLLTQGQFTARNFDLGLLNTPPPLDNFRTQFSASMPLWDGGQISGRVRDARLEAQSAAKSGERTRQEVIFAVIQAYLNGLLSAENVRVAHAAVAQTQADLERAQAREGQGLGVPSDLLSAKVQLAQAQEDLLRARSAQAIAQAALNVAIGIEEGAATELAGQLGETTFEAGTLDERQRRALTGRPDFQQFEIGKERAANGVRMARAEFLPKVDLFSAWEEDNQTFLTRGGNNWAVAATLTFNLFDGGANRARLKESRARERQADSARAQMASAVRLQVREAFLNLNTARDRLEVSREAATQAEESLRIIQNRYEAGLSTITDLLRAEAARTSAQKNFFNSLYDYRLSYAALELATGELAANSPAVVR
ncbi:MAG: TolC family protein [Terriglobia bacterium]